jgi:hypothetical protein
MVGFPGFQASAGSASTPYISAIVSGDGEVAGGGLLVELLEQAAMASRPAMEAYDRNVRENVDFMRYPCLRDREWGFDR